MEGRVDRCARKRNKYRVLINNVTETDSKFNGLCIDGQEVPRDLNLISIYNFIRKLDL